MANLAICSVEGCGKHVQKQGHTLCFPHWKESQHSVKEPTPTYAESDAAASSTVVKDTWNSTHLGEYFKLSAKQINRVLHELGWIEKDGKGWKPSELGVKLKAKGLVHTRSGVPYVQWHSDICKSRILQNAAKELLVIEVEPPVVLQPAPAPEETADKTEGFREKFPAPHRTSDGHFVRSMPEIQIDNWLYENRIAHAYERLVPVEQKMYCDFYLPEYRVFIEYWGMEGNSRYEARKKKKLEIYRENNFQLIEIQKEHISNLDDYLMPLLVKLGYKLK